MLVPCLCLQCKSEVCSDVLQQHVDRKGYKAGVWLMGHTSSDPTVDLSPDATRKRKVRLGTDAMGLCRVGGFQHISWQHAAMGVSVPNKPGGLKP